MSNDGGRTSIWLDCDTGHDDAYAVLLAAYHSKANLIGISTTHGNSNVDNTTHNTLAVLEAIGAPHVPVIKGRDKPLRRDPCHAPEIHGESGLGGVTLLPRHPKATPQTESLTDVVNTILEQPPGTVHIVAVGPLTNIAILFSWSPELALHIASLSVMGGAVGRGFTGAPMGEVEGQGPRFGNMSPWAEFNIYADPEAAKSIFKNRTLAEKTTLIPLDLTHLVRGTPSVQRLLFGENKKIEYVDNQRKLSTVRSLMQEVLNFFAATYKAELNINDGPPLHDPLAILAVLEPERFVDNNGERWDVDVVVEPGLYDPQRNPGNHVGQTVVTPSSSQRGVRIPRDLDIGLFWRRIDDALHLAELRADQDKINSVGTAFGVPPNHSATSSPRRNDSSPGELDQRIASLNTWRVTAQEQNRNSEMPQV